MMLELDGLTHRYGEKLAVEEVSFEVEAGELVAILGPSGCGKTTVVQAIAGHIQPTAGQTRLRGSDVTTRPPEGRNVGVVFQEPTLFPHMSVAENVAYGLGPADVDDEDSRVAEYLDLVALDEQPTVAPAELSGGQKRRVELARALAPEPDLLVLDEPLSALDRRLRKQLQDEITRIHAETGMTTLAVTHDQEEAMALADRLVVMNDGRVSAVGPPRELYEQPPNLFVATFLGRSNTIAVEVAGGHTPAVELGGGWLRLDTDRSVPERAICHLRPQDLKIEPGETTSISLSGEIESTTDLGRRYEVTVALDCGETVTVEQTEQPPPLEQSVRVTAPTAACAVFAESGERLDQTVDRSLQPKPELLRN